MLPGFAEQMNTQQGLKAKMSCQHRQTSCKALHHCTRVGRVTGTCRKKSIRFQLLGCTALHPALCCPRSFVVPPSVTGMATVELESPNSFVKWAWSPFYTKRKLGREEQDLPRVANGHNLFPRKQLSLSPTASLLCL